MKKTKKIKQAEPAVQLVDDGSKTAVPEKNETPPLSASEAAIFKQANNPLGDPGKI